MSGGAGGARPVSTGPPPPPPPPADERGRPRIGRYELLRRLGAGGMAEVHLARASGFEGFEKLLVLKRILPHLAADDHFVQMFLAEARLAALLQHPNIVQTYDLGRDGAEFFFTMEFVYGENAYAISRAARKRNEQVPFHYAISIVIGAAAGLHYAHERVGMDGQPLGIVHRDVSPTNIMVSYDGCTKVADFGIAKVTNRTDVTQAGIRKGKVPYMSPEQCRAHRVDRRSDVFALGICLYELSTGARLFEGDNEFGVMNRIVTGDIPLPSRRRADYPRALERIVVKALSVDIQQRYETCQHLQHDLEAFLRETRLDGSPSALARWMHHMFQPQPFPWGALHGHTTVGGGNAKPTVAGAGSGLGSRPGDLISRPDMTPLSGVGSHPTPPHSNGSMVPSAPGPGSARYGTHAGPPRTGARANDGGTLKGIAMGLGIVAAVAVVGVGGLVIYKQTDAGAGTAAASLEPGASTESPKPPEEPMPIEPTPSEAGVVAEQPAVEDPAPAVEPEPESEPAPEPEPAGEEVEVDVEVLEEPEPEPEPEPTRDGRSGTKSSSQKKPAAKKPSATKKKKPQKKKPQKKGAEADPDAFWGG